MSRAAKVSLVFSLVAVFAAYMAWREQQRFSQASSMSLASSQATNLTNRLPRLLLLADDSTDAGRQMSQIMEALRADYVSSFRIESIDVRQQPEVVKTHRIQSVPAQIFFDINQKELFRHEGVMSKEDILAKWKELGGTVLSNSPHSGMRIAD